MAREGSSRDSARERSPFPGVAHPPLDTLRDVIARLERASIACALGGSAVLARISLTREIHDWDVTADADLDTLAAVLAEYPAERFGSSGVHADHKLTLIGGEVEVIARFAFKVEGGVVRIPTFVAERVADLPLASPVAWAAAYTLLGREAKADALFGALTKRGADREVVDALLAQPLPQPLAERLRGLPLM
ncbi:MAG TPA: hypothetical protein VL332_06670 [Candidatus Saccharimonadaceae bacterium]|nr:hypothetical protein [Candidatus Saccharimonadaceae bacterium]